MTTRHFDPPRYWPILFILNSVGTLRNNFHLQKILYLAQVEHHIPIPYTFVLEDYGPYSRTVKADFISLASAGLIDLDYGEGWVLRITDNGRKIIREICDAMDKKTLKGFSLCIDKWSRKGLPALREYVYAKHLPSGETYLERKEDLFHLADTLITNLDTYPISSNKLLLIGALDYSRVALEREQIRDVAQRNHFLSAAAQLLDQIGIIYDETSMKPALLRELRLAQFREDFDHFQDVCEQYQVLPAIYDDRTDLANLIR